MVECRQSSVDGRVWMVECGWSSVSLLLMLIRDRASAVYFPFYRSGKDREVDNQSSQVDHQPSQVDHQSSQVDHLSSQRDHAFC